MKKIYKRLMLFGFLFLLLQVGNSQVTKTKFELRYDEQNCWYDVYLHIVEGNAVSFIERVPLNNSFTLILPVESTGTIIESIVPSSTSWTAFNDRATIGGDGDQDKTFFVISAQSGPAGVFPELTEGDEILIFRFTSSHDVQGVKGIRKYDPALDYPGGGGAWGTGFPIGSAVNTHVGMIPPTFASSFAEATGPTVIYPGKSTKLSPVNDGTWTQTNSSVTDFDETTGEVTGLVEGRNVFTFTPNMGCATSAVITVAPEPEEVEPVGIGEAVGDLAVEFGVYSEDKGMLIPRMSEEQRLCIVGPAQGLIVFQTDSTGGFYYFDGKSWKRLSNSASQGTSSAVSSGTSAVNENIDKSQSQLISELLENQTKLMDEIKKQQAELAKLQNGGS